MREKSAINLDIARAIRESEGTARQKAEKFEVSIHIVKDILRYKTWKELVSPWSI
jgi:DNA invertase Pin-like site-specific DNA recombinase